MAWTLARRVVAAGWPSADRIGFVLPPRPASPPRSTVWSRAERPPRRDTEPPQRCVTIADLNRLRIEAEVDEFDTQRVARGDVMITARGLPWPAKRRGTVEEIPDSVVARRTRPEDPGCPIDARVLPIKIMFSEPTPLKLGQRVEIEILAEKRRLARLSQERIKR